MGIMVRPPGGKIRLLVKVQADSTMPSLAGKDWKKLWELTGIVLCLSVRFLAWHGVELPAGFCYLPRPAEWFVFDCMPVMSGNCSCKPTTCSGGF